MSDVLHMAERVDALGICETWAKANDPDMNILTDVHASTEPPHKNCRGYGGVANIISPRLQFTLLNTSSTKKMQSVAVRVGEIMIITAYVSPIATQSELIQFLNTCGAVHRGRLIIIGDLNARHSNWDHTTNSKGRGLVQWASRNGWSIAAPSRPTFVTAQGNSTVDIAIYRGLTVTEIEVATERSWNSDHHPVTLTISTTVAPRDYQTKIPIKRRTDPKVIVWAQNHYRTHIPPLIAAMNQTTDTNELDTLYTKSLNVLLKPFEVSSSRRKSRYKTGWTPKIERMSRERKQLYRRMIVTGKKEDKERHIKLDRTIKAEVRKNRLSQNKRLHRELANTKTGEVGKVVARMLQAEGRRTIDSGPCIASPQLIPARFTELMQTQQLRRRTPNMRKFEVNETFVRDVKLAIRMAPNGKAAGPDELFVEALKVDEDLCGNLLSTIWRKCGQLVRLLPAWTKAELIPIFKRGDRTEPANYRPIALLSHGRKIIEAAIARGINRTYTFHSSQLGFQRLTGTETALVRHIANSNNLKATAVLDLQKAYDSASRQTIQNLADKWLPPNLAAMVAGMLQPTTVRTRGDTENTVAEVTVGVPQGSPLSPTLFNMMMDTLAHDLDEHMQYTTLHGNGAKTWDITMFADDVKLQADDSPTLQQALNATGTWATKYNMTWNIDKCTVMIPRDWGNTLFCLMGKQITQATTAVYLGMTAKADGISPAACISRIQKARSRIKLLRSCGIHAGKIASDMMLAICKSCILSTATYGLHLIKPDYDLEAGWKKMEKEIFRTCLGCYAPRFHHRLRTLSGLQSLRERQEVALTGTEKRARARSLLKPMDVTAKRDVENTQYLRSTLAATEDKTMRDLRRQWEATEKTKPRGIPRAPPPALAIKDRRLRRACTYWYLGAPTSEPTHQQGNGESLNCKLLGKYMKKPTWKSHDQAKVKTLMMETGIL